MLGPLKILGPFLQISRKGDALFARHLALRSFAYFGVALLLAAFVGGRSLRKFNIRVQVLAIAAASTSSTASPRTSTTGSLRDATRSPLPHRSLRVRRKQR